MRQNQPKNTEQQNAPMRSQLFLLNREIFVLWEREVVDWVSFRSKVVRISCPMLADLSRISSAFSRIVSVGEEAWCLKRMIKAIMT
jgi:hypothetical protein